MAGSASALFLISLDWATQYRLKNPNLLYFLPLAGFFSGFIYWKLGRAVEAGNNLLLDEIHDPKSRVPLRMGPMILLFTVLSHLFGASVGREGTAVQMGGSLADQLSSPFRLKSEERRLLLMAGISAGFASVFGTPLAGAIFGLEVLVVGRLSYLALFPCLLSSILANQVCHFYGVEHVSYALGAVPEFSLSLMLKVMAGGLIFGLVARLFVLMMHQFLCWFCKIGFAPLRPVFGGLIIIVLCSTLDGHRYLGLGIPVIQESFVKELGICESSLKLLFTTVCLGSGFKGGEVTPLFFIGSTLGNWLAQIFDAPLSLFAALGFVSVFAGAANAPLSCLLMAMELFGSPVGIYAALSVMMSYLVSGQSGIYASQKTNEKGWPISPQRKK